MEGPPSWSDSPATMMLDSCNRCIHHATYLAIAGLLFVAWWAGGLVMGMAIPCPKGDNVLVCFFLRNAAIGMVIILAAVLLVACFASWCMNRVAREREARAVYGVRL